MRITGLTGLAAAAMFFLFPQAAPAQMYYYPPTVQYYYPPTTSYYYDPGAGAPVTYATPIMPSSYVAREPGVRVYGPGQYYSYSPFYYSPSSQYYSGYYYPGYTTYYRTWRTWR